MSVKNQQEKVKDVLAMCEIHWLVNRIPEDKVLEMSHELEQHLRDAVQDGKPIEAVVGSDLDAFAESWAEEARPSMFPLDRVIEHAYVLCLFVAIATTIYHVLAWDLVVPLHWSEVLFFLLFPALLSRPVIKPTPRNQPWWKRWLVPVALALAFVALAQGLSIVTLGSMNAVLLEWPWYATLLAMVGAVVLSRFRQKSRSRKEQA